MNNKNNYIDLKTELLLKKRRRSVRKNIIYNIGNGVINYIVCHIKHIVKKHQQISPENQTENYYYIPDMM